MTGEETAKLQALFDKQAIAEVLYLYCQAVDRRDFELLRTVYHEDAHDDHGMYNGPISGLIDMVSKLPADTVASSHHAVTNILITLDGDTARVVSYLNAMHRRKTPEGMVDDFLKCRYLDRFERRNGAWKIARRTVVYDWGVTKPAIMKAWWDDVPGDFKFGTKDRDDPSYQG